MIYCPKKYQKPVIDINEKLLQLEGELSDEDAKSTLAQFLRGNLGLATELISGIKLAAYQEMTLRAFFNRDFNLCVWCRGGSKSFIAAVFCFLQSIFEPNSKILIAGPTFRTARNIFSELEKITKNPGAELLAQAFSTEPSHKNDLLKWEISNGSSIMAIPLNGDKIRGFRANVLILDEFLLLSEDIVKNVLMPFLIAPRNIGERLKIREQEDLLIKAGLMTAEERTIFTSTAKMIALSSASYTFENLYKTYSEWLANIADESKTEGASYFVSQIGFEALPKDMIEQTVLEEASSGGLNNPSFLREYGALFTDGSEGYFSAKKMQECTIPDGEDPHLKLVGLKDKKYILAIDPSFSSSPSSDYFAMSVMELDEDSKDSTLVHNYAVAGGDLKDHINYLYYLMKSFNVVLVVIDSADGNFLQSANESEKFADNKIEFKFIDDWMGDASDNDWIENLKNAKRQYNLESKRIVIRQFFSSEAIRRMNEHLQSSIDYKRIWFGSRIRPIGTTFDKVVCSRVNLEHTGYNNIGDLIDNQDEMISEVKRQCALIEVKTTAKGNQSFDLPNHLKRSSSATRARKDNYTTLMLGAWGTKCYFEIMETSIQQTFETFTPVFI
jgi:hypothetical protein